MRRTKSLGAEHREISLCTADESKYLSAQIVRSED